MGIYDRISIRCVHCKKRTSFQTKILGDNVKHIFSMGDKILNREFFDKVVLLKSSCSKCYKNNAIRIINGKIIEVVLPEEANCFEHPYGDYELEDELKTLIKEKLKKKK